MGAGIQELHPDDPAVSIEIDVKDRSELDSLLDTRGRVVQQYLEDVGLCVICIDGHLSALDPHGDYDPVPLVNDNP